MRTINGLSLPAVIVDAMAAGRWAAPADAAVYERIFGERPVTPELYDWELMDRETAALLDCEPFWQDMGGDGVDPDRAILIGGLGPDMPIALDFRFSDVDPRVLYLSASGWRIVSESAAGLLEKLAI